MENRAHAIAAVSFLIVFSVGAVLIFFWLTSAPQTPRMYRIITQQSVAGLAPESKVMFKGLQVGRVQSVRFDPQDRSRVIIDFRVQSKTWITRATYAVLAMKGLIGGRILQLEVGEGSREPLHTSSAQPAHIPLRKGMLGQLKQAARENLQQLHDLLASANALLGKKNRGHISATIQQLDDLTVRLVTLEQQLTPTINQLPTLLADVHDTLAQTQTVLADTSSLIKQARAPVSKAGELEDTLQQLGGKLDRQTLPGIHDLTQSLTRTSRLLQELTQELTAKPQSLIFGPPKTRPGPGEPGFQANGPYGGGDE